MAVIRTIFCSGCSRNKEVYVSSGRYPNLCSECEKNAKITKREEALREIRELPLEERVARLEALLYEHCLSPHNQGPMSFS